MYKDKIVYVAGPYSKGDVAVNVKRAIDYGMHINDCGGYAIVPHLTHFMHIIHNRKYEYWLEVDNRIIPKCDMLVRLSGESSGADKEVELAKSLNIPVIYLKGI